MPPCCQVDIWYAFGNWKLLTSCKTVQQYQNIETQPLLFASPQTRINSYWFLWNSIWTVRIWTVKFPGDIWTVKTGLGLGFLFGLRLVLGLELVFGLRLVMTVQFMTVQILTVQVKTGNLIKLPGDGNQVPEVYPTVLFDLLQQCGKIRKNVNDFWPSSKNRKLYILSS